MTLSCNVVLGVIAQLFNGWRDVEKSLEVAIDIVGGTISDEELLSPFISDREGEKLNRIARGQKGAAVAQTIDLGVACERSDAEADEAHVFRINQVSAGDLGHAFHGCVPSIRMNLIGGRELRRIAFLFVPTCNVIRAGKHNFVDARVLRQLKQAHVDPDIGKFMGVLSNIVFGYVSQVNQNVLMAADILCEGVVTDIA